MTTPTASKSLRLRALDAAHVGFLFVSSFAIAAFAVLIIGDKGEGMQ